MDSTAIREDLGFAPRSGGAPTFGAMSTKTTTACPAKPKKKSTSKRRYTLRLRARKLRREGVGTRTIAKTLGITRKELRDLEAKVIRPKPDQLAGVSWIAFLESITELREEDPRLVAGEQLDDTRSRAYYRWTQEGVQPSLFSADSFLTAIGLHIDNFFEWCEANGFEPWACGRPPEWMRDPVAA